MKIIRDFAKAYIQGDISGSVNIYCEQVLTGSKLVGAISIIKNQEKIVREVVKSRQCKVYFDYPFTHERGVAYIYKYKFVLMLMKELWFHEKWKVEDTHTASEIWITGKMFGYSDFEIAKYLEKHGYIKEPFK